MAFLTQLRKKGQNLFQESLKYQVSKSFILTQVFTDIFLQFAGKAPRKSGRRKEISNGTLLSLFCNSLHKRPQKNLVLE